MHADISRDTFDPTSDFTRVLRLQGRVILDADTNEQTDILLHQVRSLTRLLIGPYGGEATAFQVAINSSSDDFTIGTGHYSVEGLCCQSRRSDGDPWTYRNQPFRRHGNNPMPDLSKTCLIYLHLWERLVDQLHYPHMREAALEGPETAARTQLVWQVRIWSKTSPGFLLNGADLELSSMPPKTPLDWAVFVHTQLTAVQGRLSARLAPTPKGVIEASPASPESRYRGLENQLYRVEIHAGGPAATATFKWSRENGSVSWPIESLEGNRVVLRSWPRDERLGLALRNGVVEILDDRNTLEFEPGTLAQVSGISRADRSLDLAWPKGTHPPQYRRVPEDQDLHPVLRRWDHAPSDEMFGVRLRKSGNRALLHELEQGVQVTFLDRDASGKALQYRTGDYWLIPARATPGHIEWPSRLVDGRTEPLNLPPHGIRHYFAPLAWINAAGDLSDLRRIILDLTKSAAP